MKKIPIFLVLLLLACSNHDNPPPQLPIVEPPTPENFTVTSPSAGIYDLSWSVSNPSVVNYYNLYYLDPYYGPIFADTTAATSIQLSVGGGFSGIVWGVSSVTIENVEGRIVYASE